MARRKGKSGRISVFKGRETKLNRAIFQILALIGPLAIYDICKEVRKQERLKHTKYAVVNRRVRILEESRYLGEAGTRKTRAGFTVSLYQLTLRGYLALMLYGISLDKFIQEADETSMLNIVATFTSSIESFN